MVTRDIISRPCEDACATVTTDRRVAGAPVYRCPGCDSEWIELDERTSSAATGTGTPTAIEPTSGSAAGIAPATSDAASAAQAPPQPSTASTATGYPRLVQTVLDAPSVRDLAEFYRALLGLVYRPGDAPPFHGSDEPDWLVLRHQDGTPALAFQENDRHVPPTWPHPGVPQQLHLDMAVPERAALDVVRLRVEGLGGRVLLDRTDDELEPLFVFADPAGHPFCVFVG